LPALPAEMGEGIAPEAAAIDFVKNLLPGARVLVALSGGGDSVGLLVALWRAASADGRGVEICAVTVDHRLRAGSAREAEAMAAFCKTIGVVHRSEAWEGDKPETAISDAARTARYQLLCAAAQSLKACVIVTGHTLDDQLETVEMRQSRSADAAGRGLAGMAPATLFYGRHWVSRPFLNVRRSAIRDFLQAISISWFEDPSNENIAFERVRVRKAASFQADATEIGRYAARRTALSSQAASFISLHCSMPLPQLYRIDCADGFGDDASRLAAATLIAGAGGRSFLAPSASLDRLWLALADGKDFRLSISRTVAERRGRELYICRDGRDIPGLTMVLPGTQCVWDGRFLIENNGKGSIVVVAGDATAALEGLGPRVLRRAQAGLPHVTDAAIGHIAQTVLMRAFLSPFETVLPSFDLELANSVASLVGMPSFRMKFLAQSEVD
jgi:tRNA(Ile)-lysidine synthase